MSVQTIETVTMGDGAKLRIARYEPSGAAVAVVQFVHGFAEHIGHYGRVAERFAEGGFVFVMHEQRGFGVHGQAAKGVVPSFERLLEDVDETRDRIGAWYPNVPVTLFGFSMGGNIALNYLLKYGEARYARAIIESPWLALYKPLPRFVTWFARGVGRLLPKATVPSRLNVAAITRRAEGADVRATDDLFHDRISFLLYAAVMDGSAYVAANAANIKLPALLLCGGGDRIVSAEAVRALARTMGANVRFSEYADGYHCLHMDLVCDEVLDEIFQFIQADA